MLILTNSVCFYIAARLARAKAANFNHNQKKLKNEKATIDLNYLVLYPGLL